MRETNLPEEKGIFFHQEELAPELPSLESIVSWIHTILRQECRDLQSLYYVFVTDAVLLEINQKYLQHDTLTDIITFPYQTDPAEAEIYISVDRVRSNAHNFRVPVRDEFLRVIAHGVLHLCGWDDHTDHGMRLMRLREDACMAQIGIIPEAYPVSPV